MRAIILAVVMLATVAGCSQGPEKVEQRFSELGAECFSLAAYEVIRVETLLRLAPPCCGKCKDGKVRSGDGLAWVDCPCDPGCECKTKPAGSGK